MYKVAKTITVFVLLTLSTSLVGQNKYTLDSTVLTSRVVKDSLDIPWEIIWGPDNNIWTTERFGRVSRINPKTGKQQVLLDLSSQVYENAEAGMLGMALHPNFPTTSHVFIAYTYREGSNIKERLVRYNYNGSKLTPADTLIENITGNTTHIGCRLIFLKDNTLLMTTGDAQKQSLPLDTNSVVGKVLRLNTDGSIPRDNPNPNSYVFSYGHRNAQGLWLAPNGTIYSSEHGPTTDDELNIITAKGNYGWPSVAGFCDSPPEDAYCKVNNVVEPLAAWTPTIAPSDIIWYRHPAIPEFKDKLLMTVLKDKSLISFDFNLQGNQVTKQTKYFKGEFGRLRDICVSPEGKIYLATNGTQWRNTNPFTHKIIELSNEAFTSIEEKYILKEISLLPNPISTGNNISFKLPNSIKGTALIMDASGKVLKQQEIQNKSEIEIPYPPGIYFWTITTVNGSIRQGKLMVKE